MRKLIKFITAVGSIDTSGISMLEEVKKNMDRRGLKVSILLINTNSTIKMNDFHISRFQTNNIY